MKKNICFLLVSLLWAFNAHAQYAVVHSFNSTDGSNPFASLVSDGAYLYGVTFRGGTGDRGTIFKISLVDGTFTLLHSFNGTDGNGPSGHYVLTAIFSTV